MSIAKKDNIGKICLFASGKKYNFINSHERYLMRIGLITDAYRSFIYENRPPSHFYTVSHNSYLNMRLAEEGRQEYKFNDDSMSIDPDCLYIPENYKENGIKINSRILYITDDKTVVETVANDVFPTYIKAYSLKSGERFTDIPHERILAVNGEATPNLAGKYSMQAVPVEDLEEGDIVQMYHNSNFIQLVNKSTGLFNDNIIYPSKGTCLKLIDEEITLFNENLGFLDVCDLA
jgi:hypothetical protein